MLEQFHDLQFEQLPDGTVRMEQHDHCGESYTIDAHPVQIIHMARVLVGAKASPDAKRIEILERRIRWLRDRFLECWAAVPRDLGASAEATEFGAWIQASIDVATEYCADLTPEETSNKKGAQQVMQAELPLTTNGGTK